jgi:hypothetical protein
MLHFASFASLREDSRQAAKHAELCVLELFLADRREFIDPKDS